MRLHQYRRGPRSPRRRAALARLEDASSHAPPELERALAGEGCSQAHGRASSTQSTRDRRARGGSPRRGRGVGRERAPFLVHRLTRAGSEAVTTGVAGGLTCRVMEHARPIELHGEAVTLAQAMALFPQRDDHRAFEQPDLLMDDDLARAGHGCRTRHVPREEVDLGDSHGLGATGGEDRPSQIARRGSFRRRTG